ncbi:protein YIPF3-like isoform X2 [Amphiura filiformis]|uniref:protein YIPF3-like isoform X2 n=1 Tax=Amphiura filiformis TaxID=82378 RepID=UPI003B21B707
MATTDWYAKSENQMNSSAVIELSDGADDDGSVGDMEISAGTRQQAELHHEDGRDEEEPGTEATLMDAMKSQMADSVWQAGKQQARKAFDLYGNIDVLRPYFDVEPKILVSRLILSLVPRVPRGTPQKAVGELYGPVMIVLTLVAILLMGMKDAGHTVREGTLMGTAMGVCFGYWFIASGLFYGVAFVCNTHITFLQVLSMTGYGMFSFCTVLFIGTVLHSDYSHSLFYFLWGVVGGIAVLKMIGVYLSRTAGKTQRLAICGVVGFVHLVFLLYLHFAYHKIVEEVDEVVNELQEGRPLDIVERDTANAAGQNVPEIINKAAADVVKLVTKLHRKSLMVFNKRNLLWRNLGMQSGMQLVILRKMLVLKLPKRWIWNKGGDDRCALFAIKFLN